MRDPKNVKKENSGARRAAAERIRAYQAQKKSLMKLFLILFGASLLLALAGILLTLLTDVVFVKNTGMAENGGREVTVSGAAFLKALFTGKYTSPDFDNLAVPFYLYAGSYCQSAAVLTLFSVVFFALTLLLSGLNLLCAFIRQEYALSVCSTICSALSAIFSIALFAVALSMKNGDILSVYCSGNPACSIHSDLIWSILVSAVLLGCNLFSAIKFLELQKIKRGKKS